MPVPVNFDLGTSEEENSLVPQPPPDFLALGLDVGVGGLLDLRWREAHLCVDNKAYLSATIAMGSLQFVGRTIVGRPRASSGVGKPFQVCLEKRYGESERSS